jgi:ABC-type bacteriocin/lantibiotic exporter with double-glycine peptidase domain
MSKWTQNLKSYLISFVKLLQKLLENKMDIQTQNDLLAAASEYEEQQAVLEIISAQSLWNSISTKSIEHYFGKKQATIIKLN